MYVDDSCYFGNSDETEKLFYDELSNRFDVDYRGDVHWFLSMRIYRFANGDFMLDQSRFTKNCINKFCDPKSPWGAPEYQDTPAPIKYVYSKENAKQEDNKKKISKHYPGLNFISAVCTLLYLDIITFNIHQLSLLPHQVVYLLENTF